jgi:Flp pilus assembly protein TadG
MSFVKSPRTISIRGGSTIIEFSLSAFMLMILAFATIELGRMILVYTTVADSARAGVRYAIVHGSSRTGSGVNGPSNTADSSQVVTVVKNFAGAGLLDINRLTVRVTYLDIFPENDPGKRVSVTVVYPYDPFTTYLPLRVPLGTTTQGVIAF